VRRAAPPAYPTTVREPRSLTAIRVAEAASAAIGAGAALGAIADAERVGQARARGELGPDALKRIARASRRRREADAEYEQEIPPRRADRP
jgi:hypothetical protein